METVTVSPKYQDVIPLDIRDSRGIRPGQKVQVIHDGDRVESDPGGEQCHIWLEVNRTAD